MKQKIFNRITGLLLVAFFFFACKDNDSKEEVNATTAADSQVKSIFINGDSIHYIDIGKGDPVIFIHGTLSDYRVWGAQIDTFSKTHRVIAYSRRYAYPNKQVVNDSADYSPVIHARDLTELIKALDLGPVHLVGHSYGAYTALHATLDHPELIKTLTLGEPPVIPMIMNVPGGDTLGNSFFAITQPATEAFKSGNDDKAVSIFANWVLGDTNYYTQAPAEARAAMLSNTLELRGFLLSGKPFPPIMCNDLKKINTPVLLLMGEKSLPLFTTIIGEIEKCLVKKEKIVLANTSHALEMENPVEFNKVVLGFIDKH